MLMAEYCALLQIEPLPDLELVPASAIPGCDAMVDFDDERATHWRIKIRRGRHANPERVMVHELLHVKTGLTDATHEAWICDVADALLARRENGNV
jgi:hypothetical protein